VTILSGISPEKPNRNEQSIAAIDKLNDESTPIFQNFQLKLHF